MRQKKSKLIYYIIALIVFAGLFYVATHQIPLKTEHVEQTIPNKFLAK